MLEALNVKHRTDQPTISLNFTNYGKKIIAKSLIYTLLTGNVEWSPNGLR